MSTDVQLTTIRTGVRYKLDEPTADRWSNDEIDRAINRSIWKLQSRVAQYNNDFFVRVSTVTASAGSYRLSYPTDLWGQRIRHLAYYPSATVATGESHWVKPGQLEWVYQNLDYSGTPVNFAFEGGYLTFAPLLESNSCFRFIYEKKEDTLTNDTDTLALFKDEHTDIIELDAAINLLKSKGLDASDLKDEYQERLIDLAGDVQFMAPFELPQTNID